MQENWWAGTSLPDWASGFGEGTMDFSPLLGEAATGYVYWLLNVSGTVIYVGHTGQCKETSRRADAQGRVVAGRHLIERIKGHTRAGEGFPWWDEVAYIFAREVPVANLAAVEAEEIYRHQPAYNIQGKSPRAA